LRNTKFSALSNRRSSVDVPVRKIIKVPKERNKFAVLNSGIKKK